MTIRRRHVKGGPVPQAIPCALRHRRNVRPHARLYEQLDDFQVARPSRIKKSRLRIRDTQPIQLRTGLRRRPGYHGLLNHGLLNHGLLNLLHRLLLHGFPVPVTCIPCRQRILDRNRRTIHRRNIPCWHFVQRRIRLASLFTRKNLRQRTIRRRLTRRAAGGRGLLLAAREQRRASEDGQQIQIAHGSISLIERIGYLVGTGPPACASETARLQQGRVKDDAH